MITASLGQYLHISIKETNKSVDIFTSSNNLLIAWISDDSIFEEWYALWLEGDEKKKRDIVNCMCQYGFESEDRYEIIPNTPF